MTVSNSAAPRYPRGFGAVLAAQFLSALADNALVFVAVALLKARHAPDWHTPLLQEAFTIGFILLAPFVGPLADTFPKGRVMLASNALKLGGAVLLLAGLHPLAAYAVVGVGAAVYSPAKYGILGELVGERALVKANGLLEGSTIVAILIGAVSGGVLADRSLPGAAASVAVCYALAALANLRVPRLPPAHPAKTLAPGALLRDFGHSTRLLWQVRAARLSLLGTSVFWGIAAALRFLLILWVPFALGVNDNGTAAKLNGAVAVGIAVGAGLAGQFVKLETVRRALPAGLLLGPLVVCLALSHGLAVGILVLAALGACGGFYVVPLNALLQEKGHATVGAGHAVAAQNLFENLAMMLMVGLYTFAVRAGAPVPATAAGLGLLIFAVIALLSRAFARKTN